MSQPSSGQGTLRSHLAPIDWTVSRSRNEPAALRKKESRGSASRAVSSVLNRSGAGGPSAEPETEATGENERLLKRLLDKSGTKREITLQDARSWGFGKSECDERMLKVVFDCGKELGFGDWEVRHKSALDRRGHAVFTKAAWSAIEGNPASKDKFKDMTLRRQDFVFGDEEE